MRRILRWGVRLLALAFLAGAVVTWLAPDRVLPAAAEFLDVSEPPRQTDYVLILNGDPNTRPFAAAALVRAGLVREVLLTRQRLTLESGDVQDGTMLSEFELTKRVLRARGVSAEAIRVLPGEIGNTFDEARCLAAFLGAQPGATVAVVTNSFHTRRARWIFRRVLGEDAGRVYFVGVPRDGVDDRAWWRSHKGWRVYLSEYGKLLYYRVRRG